MNYTSGKVCLLETTAGGFKTYFLSYFATLSVNILSV